MELVKKYDHVLDFLQDIESIHPSLIKRSSVESGYRTGFTGAKDYSEAAKYAAEGFDVNLFRELQNQVSVLSNSAKHINEIYDVQGSYVDVDRFLEGDPENMVDFQETEKKQSLDLFFNCAEPGIVEMEQMQYKGIIIACLVDELESIGVRCRVHVCSHSDFPKTSKKSQLFAVLLKDFDQPLSISHIFGACHPAFNRRLKFRWVEKYFPRDASHEYGYAVELNEDSFRETFGSENVFLIQNTYWIIQNYLEDMRSTQSAANAYHKMLEAASNHLGIDIELQD